MLRRFALLAASLLAAAVLVSPGVASATPAPDCFDVDFAQTCFANFENTFVNTVLCDFPVTVHVDGSIRYRQFSNAEERHLVFRATIVNPATGRSFFDGTDFNERATFLPDGSVAVRQTGIQHNAVVDSGERLFHQSGNHSFVVDSADQLISENFNGRWESEAAFPGKVCPFLATPA